MTRKQSRDFAFKLLYQVDIQKEDAENVLELFYEQNEVINDNAKKYISNVVLGVQLNKEEIDAMITKYARGWSIDRMSKLAAAALRLAIFEVVYCSDIPDAVAVNEAVSLVKLYDTEESTGFVNGILASVLGDRNNDDNSKQS